MISRFNSPLAAFSIWLKAPYHLFRRYSQSSHLNCLAFVWSMPSPLSLRLRSMMGGLHKTIIRNRTVNIENVVTFIGDAQRFELLRARRQRTTIQVVDGSHAIRAPVECVFGRRPAETEPLSPNLLMTRLGIRRRKLCRVHYQTLFGIPGSANAQPLSTREPLHRTQLPKSVDVRAARFASQALLRTPQLERETAPPERFNSLSRVSMKPPNVRSNAKVKIKHPIGRCPPVRKKLPQAKSFLSIRQTQAAETRRVIN